MQTFQTPTRIIFMGTPDFAVPSFEALLNLSLIRANRRIVPERTKRAEGLPLLIVGVITQPNRPVGRKQVQTPPPVKVMAHKLDLPVLQPEKLHDPKTIEQIRALAPDLIVVAAYGQMIPKAILELPKYGAINVHASLLPKYRGASPIQAAIAAGEAETGITIMLMDERLDHGPILAQAGVPIVPDETGDSLSTKLARVGAELLAATLPEWIAGQIKPKEQDHTQATMTKLLTREDGKIDWNQPADVIERKIRAYHPWPGTWTLGKRDQVRLNILRVLILSGVSPDKVGTNEVEGSLANASPGSVFKTTAAFAVICGPSTFSPSTGGGERGGGFIALEILTLQPEGKRPMSAADFLRGHVDIIGSRLA